MSISPKLRNSTPWNDARDTDGSWAKRHEERRINLDALAALMRGPWEYQLKFVVSQASDLQEIEELLTNLNARMQQHAASLQGSRPSAAPSIIDRQRVLLMPEGIAPAPPGSRDWLVRACIEGGFRYCHRVHVELFGHKRGT
jgi:7-carboxy-7-deazaguanine synthase